MKFAITLFLLTAAAFAQGGRRAGGFVPGQQRPPGDPAQIARGKTLYGISCTGCHGADLRGGDMGGPNLLRSQTRPQRSGRRTDCPHHSRAAARASGMPAIPMSAADAKAVAAYVRSVLETIGRQGMPPSVGQAAPSVAGGQRRGRTGLLRRQVRRLPFRHGRSARHRHPHSRSQGSAELLGLRRRTADARGGGGAANASAAAPSPSPSRLPSGEKVEGRLVRIDDFLVTARLCRTAPSAPSAASATSPRSTCTTP